MSTAQRRRGKSLHLELPGSAPEEPPAIAALFLIQFDVKAGYTIAWKQSIPGLEIAESVEFKSLPSGLHNVKEDLVYFIHDDEHAGVSAFVNKSTDRWERNALMLSVGALVPLDQGRLGRAWKHAERLKEIAGELVLDPSKTQTLEGYWIHYRLKEGSESSNRSSSKSPNRTATRDRARSNASGYGMPSISLGLSPYHPALSFPTLIDTFGPLIYPLYKAAILRKRILVMHEAPVELACNFVYDVSILSNIPSSISDLVPLEPLPSRLDPLFSVGIHDIDNLTRRIPTGDNPDPDYGWIACSTDDVLSMKTNICDVLVTIPPPYSHKAKEKAWPKLRTSAGEEIRASQRDLRRYRTLRQSLKKYMPRSHSNSPYSTRTRALTTGPTHRASSSASDDDADSQTGLLPGLENTHETFDDASSTTNEKLIEPLSWSALAYNSFIWWASAGEKRADLEDEAERDAAMFRDFGAYPAATADAHGGGGSGGGGSHGGTRPRSASERRRRRRSSPLATPGMPMMTDGKAHAPEMAIIAYFHRLTARILGTLAQLVDSCDAREEESAPAGGRDGEGKDEGPGAPVYVGSEDMVRMGLDSWSEGDRRFVEELLDFYWGRKADLQGGRIECCGVRIL